MIAMLIVDGRGTVLASLADNENVFMPGDAPAEIKEWVESGVPSLKGTAGPLIKEQPITVSADDPLWGLAVQEECERRGWGIYEVNETT